MIVGGEAVRRGCQRRERRPVMELRLRLERMETGEEERVVLVEVGVRCISAMIFGLSRLLVLLAVEKRREEAVGDGEVAKNNGKEVMSKDSWTIAQWIVNRTGREYLNQEGSTPTTRK